MAHDMLQVLKSMTWTEWGRYVMFGDVGPSYVNVHTDPTPMRTAVMDARVMDSNSSKEAIGRRLKALRVALGATQGHMARLAGYAGPNGWNQVENGVNRIPIHHAQELCKHTRVDMNWIFQGDEGGVGPDLALKIRQALDDLWNVRKSR